MGSPRPALARGNPYMARLMVRCNNDVALRYHETVIEVGTPPFWRSSMLARPRKAVSLHLGGKLRHIVPEHDDIVLPAVDIPDVVAEQRLRLEAKALEQGDRGLLVDRHLHRELLQAFAQSQGKGFLRQRPADALPAHIQRHHHPDAADMGRPG